MNSKIYIVFALNLMVNSLSCTSKNMSADITCVAQTFNEIAHYFEASLKFYTALDIFNKKQNVSALEIYCKYCSQRSLPCDELIVKIQAKAMDVAIGAEAEIANTARKKMLSRYDEITRLLCTGSLDEIKKFMTKIAQEENIPCEECQKVEWISAKECLCE